MSTNAIYRAFGSRVWRRRLVGLMALVLAAFPLVGWLSKEVWPVALNLVPFGLVSVLLAVSTQGLLGRPVSSLDERQRALRGNLFSGLYTTGACVGLACGVAATVAPLRLEPGPAAGVLIVAVNLAFMLPSLVLAWKLPDEVDDDA